MLNKHNLNIASLASKDASRFTLSGILVTPERTVVTDGHVLVTVTTPKMKVDDFPVLEGLSPATIEFEPFVLPSDAALNIAKNIPKSHLPILNNAVVSGDSNSDSAVIVTTDLETQKPFRVKKIKGNFPDYERVIPKAEPKIKINFDAKILQNVLKQCIDFRGKDKPIISFEIIDDSGPIKITSKNRDGQELLALVMPFRDKP